MGGNVSNIYKHLDWQKKWECDRLLANRTRTQLGAVRFIAKEPNATNRARTSSIPASPSSCPSLLTIATRNRRAMMNRPGDRERCVLPSCLYQAVERRRVDEGNSLPNLPVRRQPQQG